MGKHQALGRVTAEVLGDAQAVGVGGEIETLDMAADGDPFTIKYKFVTALQKLSPGTLSVLIADDQDRARRFFQNVSGVER